MEIIYKGRGQGKTAELIKRSAETGIYIVVSNRNHALNIVRRAQEMGYNNIPFPITIEEVLRHGFRGTYIKKVLVDDVDLIIKYLLKSVECETMTLTKSEENDKNDEFDWQLSNYNISNNDSWI